MSQVDPLILNEQDEQGAVGQCVIARISSRRLGSQSNKARKGQPRNGISSQNAITPERPSTTQSIELLPGSETPELSPPFRSESPAGQNMATIDIQRLFENREFEGRLLQFISERMDPRRRSNSPEQSDIQPPSYRQD